MEFVAEVGWQEGKRCLNGRALFMSGLLQMLDEIQEILVCLNRNGAVAESPRLTFFLEELEIGGRVVMLLSRPERLDNMVLQSFV